MGLGSWEANKLTVLVRVAIAALKSHYQSNLGKNGLIFILYIQGTVKLKEVRAGTQTGHELGGRS